MSSCRSPVAEHWRVKQGFLGLTPGSFWLFHFPLLSKFIYWGNPERAPHQRDCMRVYVCMSAYVHVAMCNHSFSFHKNELIDLAERIWLEGLHRPVTNSESGGKLCNYKLIKSYSDTASFVLAPLSPGQRWEWLRCVLGASHWHTVKNWRLI